MNRNIRSKFNILLQHRARLTALSLLLTLLLSACGSAAPRRSGGAGGGVPAQVRIDVAGTLTAQPTATTTLTETPSPTPTQPPTATPMATQPPTFFSTFLICNNLEFIGDASVPDGSILAPGQKFTKTWRVENTGSCPWTPVYSLIFFSGDRMGGVRTQIGQTVNPNGRAEISVNLTAPTRTGTYVGFWRLADQYGHVFGQTLDFEIVVEAPTASPGPASSAPNVVPTNTLDPLRIPNGTGKGSGY